MVGLGAWLARANLLLAVSRAVNSLSANGPWGMSAAEWRPAPRKQLSYSDGLGRPSGHEVEFGAVESREYP